MDTPYKAGRVVDNACGRRKFVDSRCSHSNGGCELRRRIRSEATVRANAARFTRSRSVASTTRQRCSTNSRRRSASRSCVARDPWVKNGLTSSATRSGSQAKSVSTPSPSPTGTLWFGRQPPRPAWSSQRPTRCSFPLRWPIPPDLASRRLARSLRPETAVTGMSARRLPIERTDAIRRASASSRQRSTTPASAKRGSRSNVASGEVTRLVIQRRVGGATDCRTVSMPRCLMYLSGPTLTTHRGSSLNRPGKGIWWTSAADGPAMTEPGTANAAARMRWCAADGVAATRMTVLNTGISAPDFRRRANAYLSTPAFAAWSTVTRPSCVAAIRCSSSSISKLVRSPLMPRVCRLGCDTVRSSGFALLSAQLRLRTLGLVGHDQRQRHREHRAISRL